MGTNVLPIINEKSSELFQNQFQNSNDNDKCQTRPLNAMCISTIMGEILAV